MAIKIETPPPKIMVVADPRPKKSRPTPQTLGPVTCSPTIDENFEARCRLLNYLFSADTLVGRFSPKIARFVKRTCFDQIWFFIVTNGGIIIILFDPFGQSASGRRALLYLTMLTGAGDVVMLFGDTTVNNVVVFVRFTF
uniref:Uncharacterized protein n=1 Tax=Romanomermis culicivorax TaxID=13658 RepID=A0A915KTY1_ROMCU